MHISCVGQNTHQFKDHYYTLLDLNLLYNIVASNQDLKFHGTNPCYMYI